MKKLQKEYQDVVNQYLKKFIKKHKYEFSYWVSADIGGIACFIDQYYFDFDDIRFDIDNNVEKDLIFKWQDDGIENDNKDVLNFKSYSLGLRYKHLGKLKTNI